MDWNVQCFTTNVAGIANVNVAVIVTETVASCLAEAVA